jgi:predicted MFS family arabinose efflux permease
MVLLSTAQSVSEAMIFRGMAGVAHALFWPSCEVLISTNSPPEKRVKWIALFTAAWVGGFMAGPLAGRLALEFFDYRVLFQLSAAAVAVALVPAFLLVRHGRPVGTEKHRRTSLADIKHEVTSMPTVSAVLLYYAITFGVILAVYPAYLKTAAITDQDIELLFFAFGIARFATLPFAQKLAVRGRPALAMAVALTAIGMFLSFAFTSVWMFAAALVLIGVSTSIFYPVTFNIVTRNVPLGKIGSKLGIYETLFGMGWTAGPLAVGLSSDAFGPPSPYLAFAIIGGALAGAIALRKNGSS